MLGAAAEITYEPLSNLFTSDFIGSKNGALVLYEGFKGGALALCERGFSVSVSMLSLEKMTRVYTFWVSTTYTMSECGESWCSIASSLV